MKAQSPDFLRADFGIDYLRDAATGDYLRGFAAWDRVEGALLQHVLSGPLHWLGMIDVDFSAAAFCVTARGAQLLGLTHEAAEAAADIHHFFARLQQQLARHVVALGALRLFEREPHGFRAEVQFPAEAR